MRLTQKTTTTAHSSRRTMYLPMVSGLLSADRLSSPGRHFFQ